MRAGHHIAVDCTVHHRASRVAAGSAGLIPYAALIVGRMIVKMGATFGWDALHDLMDRAADAEDVQAIRATLLATPGVLDVHDLRTRKTGDLILVDVHLDIDADLTVAQGHDIAVNARARVMRHHRVLNVMTHADPHKRETRAEVAAAIRRE